MNETLTSLAGWTLIHFIWQGAVIAAVTALSLWTLRRASAEARYVVACAGLALMLAAPVFTARTLASATTVPVPQLRQSEVRILVLQGGGGTLPAIDPATPLPGLRIAGTPEPAMPIVVAIWASGVLLLAVRLGTALWGARRLRRAASACRASRWQEAAVVLTARLGITRAVTVVERDDLVTSPATVGWLSPLIILPGAALAGLSPAQVEAILAHELAHIRRHDYLVNLVQLVAETVLFYHPAVWWLSRRIREEREHCCDDLAVEISGDVVGYAEALAEIEQFRAANPALALAASGGSLLARVARLLAPQGPSRRPGTAVAAALVLAAVFVLGAATQYLVAGPVSERVRLLRRVERIDARGAALGATLRERAPQGATRRIVIRHGSNETLRQLPALAPPPPPPAPPPLPSLGNPSARVLIAPRDQQPGRN